MGTTGITLQRKLGAVRLWWRATRVLSGVTWALSAVVVLALICYHSDRLLVLSSHAREMWRTGIGVSSLLLLALALLRPLLRRLSDVSLAADVERRFPVLRERLLTTLDLAPALAAGQAGAAAAGKPYASAFSTQMTDALARETHQAASDLNFRRAVSLRPLRNGVLTCAFTFVLLGLHMVFAREAFATWLRRMADPRADIAPYAKTRVQIVPDAVLLPRGEGTGITVKTWGDPVTTCVLKVHQDGDDSKQWTTLQLSNPTPIPNAPADEKDARKFRYRFASLAHSVSLVASASDGRSNERSVIVEDRPTLLNVRLNLHFPAYMRRKDQSLPETTGAIAAPVGTTVDVVGVANKPLKTAVYVRDNADIGPWPVHGVQTNGHLNVIRDGTYRLKLVDTHDFSNVNPPRYEIRAMKDEAPSVQILRPATDVDLVAGGSVPLVAHATDDYGVQSAKLMYDVTHEENLRTGRDSTSHIGKGALPLPGEYGATSVDIRQRWYISSVSPKVGDVIRYEVDDLDNDTVSGPHVGRSMAYRIRVVSATEMQMKLKEQLDAEQAALSSARQHEIEAQKQLAQAKVKNDPAQMTRAQETQRSVAQETKSVAQRIQDLSNQLENNNFTTPAEMERRKQAQAGLEKSAQDKMTPAADKMQAAQNAKPQSGERNQDLQQAGQQQAQAKQDLERAQQLLSRTQTAEQLAKDAQQLAQDQQRLADSDRSLAEDIKAQQQKDKNNALAPEQKTALEMQAKQQAQVNEDTRKLEQQLAQAAKEAQQRGDSKQAQELQKAADALKQGQAQSNQSQAQQSLNQNKPQQAAPAQDKAAQALQKAAQEAAKAAGQQDANQDPKTAAEKAEAAAQQLHDLAKQQQEVAKQAGQSPNGEQSKALAQKEQQIAQAAQQAQQNLSGAKSAQQSAQKAQQSLSQAGQKLGQNQAQQAQQPAQDAAKQLEDAAQQAERAAQQMRQQQQAQELAEKVERLAQIQHGLQTATQRLEGLKQKGAMNGPDLIERRQVANKQLSLEKQAQELADKIPSKAFGQALKMASGQMHPANENLSGKDLKGEDEPNTGMDTQKAQRRAAQTLDTITQALKQQAQSNQQQQQQAQSGQQQQGGSPEQQQAAEAAGELALAQGLQKQLRQDTGALDQQRAKNPNHTLTPEQQRENNQLTEGQRNAQDITQNAAQALQDAAPDAAKSAMDAGEHMAQAKQGLQQSQTGQPTQIQQDQAITGLEQASKQAQQAMQQQQQQQQQQQMAQQGAPKPGQQRNGKPGQNPFARLEGVQKGAMSTPTARAGKGFSPLAGRDQRVLRDGENERVPAEYQDLVSRYYKSLAEKKR